jgi:hypothetical protein
MAHSLIAYGESALASFYGITAQYLLGGKMRFIATAGLLVSATLSVMAAGNPTPSPAIGFIRATGNFTLDGSPTRDNATLFNGSVVETSMSPSHVVLDNGTRADLGKNSRSRIYREHLVLEKGTTQLAGNEFPLMASTLRIVSSEPFRVALLDGGKLSVTALAGAAQVRNSHGYLVALVRGGTTLNFQDSGAYTVTRLSGCLQKVRDHYVLRDTTSNVVVEIQGQNLERYVGKPVDVAGTTVAGAEVIEGASELIHVTDITRGSGKSCSPEIPFAAAAGSAGSGAGAAVGVGGLTPLAKGVILAGILISATLIGLGLSGYLGGASPQTST